LACTFSAASEKKRGGGSGKKRSRHQSRPSRPSESGPEEGRHLLCSLWEEEGRRLRVEEGRWLRGEEGRQLELLARVQGRRGSGKK
jgi:hypothetical protein